MNSRLWCFVRIDLLCCSNVVQAVMIFKIAKICFVRIDLLCRSNVVQAVIFKSARICFVMIYLLCCSNVVQIVRCQTRLCEDLLVLYCCNCCNVMQAVMINYLRLCQSLLCEDLLCCRNDTWGCAKVCFVKTCHVVVILYRQWWGTVSWHWVQHRGRESPVQPQQNSAGNIYKQL